MSHVNVALCWFKVAYNVMYNLKAPSDIGVTRMPCGEMLVTCFQINSLVLIIHNRTPNFLLLSITILLTLLPNLFAHLL